MSLFYCVLFLIFILLLGILLATFLGNNRLEGMSDMSSNSVDMSSNSTDMSSNSVDMSSNSTDVQNIGSSYDNYNHYTGSSKSAISNSTFYGQNGSTLVVNMNGTNTLTTTDTNGKIIIYAGIPSFDGTIDSYQGPNGSVAVVVKMNGSETIVIKDTMGNETVYFSKPPNNGQNNVLPNVTPSSTPSTLIAPSNQSSSTTSQTQSNNWFSNSSTPSSDNTPVSSSSSSLSSSSYDYSSSLPPGIPASQIPSGHEDLYILKSEVVPPVCPVCPVQTSKKKCPPCPACARCPEPAYDCKLVPNYSAMNGNAPVPVLNDFSTFGM